MAVVRGSWVNDTIAAVLCLGLLIAIALHLAGCVPPPEKVMNAVEVAEWTLPYQYALDACKDEAKKKPRPQQWEAYQQCEDRETLKVCEKRPSLKGSWKRCMEVMP